MRVAKKKPPQTWYWIHNKQNNYTYPEYFRGLEYGRLFNSIIFTFKLRNAYLTNLVKCGLNKDSRKYKGIAAYDPRCIDLCYDSYLAKEIEIIKPKVVFCFGSAVYKRFWDLYPETSFPFIVVTLPHPARGQQGFSNELFRHLYFSLVLEGLYKAKIYTREEGEKKYGEFLTNSK